MLANCSGRSDWRSRFAYHTWIEAKPEDEDFYNVYDVVGWRGTGGRGVIRIKRDTPDRHWYGLKLRLLTQHPGAGAESLIDTAAHLYPWKKACRAFPDPNSGPRALGNRSLLADPRRANVREVLNEKVKHREAFRPFCPSVLADKAADWFDVAATPQSPEHYMLSAVNVRPDVDDKIPAVVHVDGTARVQMVEREANPRYYELIEKFAEITGVPVLLNTSFNDSEPIVCSPDDALNTFRKTQIDRLVLGDYCVSRELV